MGESAPVRALPVPRRSAQSSREQLDADPHDTCSIVTVSSTRFASKRGQVRSKPVTVNNFSRGVAGFDYGHSFPNGGKSKRNPHDHQQDPAGRRSVVEAESLLGSLVYLVPAVPLSRLNLRPLQQQV